MKCRFCGARIRLANRTADNRRLLASALAGMNILPNADLMRYKYLSCMRAARNCMHMPPHRLNLISTQYCNKEFLYFRPWRNDLLGESINTDDFVSTCCNIYEDKYNGMGRDRPLMSLFWHCSSEYIDLKHRIIVIDIFKGRGHIKK